MPNKRLLEIFDKLPNTSAAGTPRLSDYGSSPKLIQIVDRKISKLSDLLTESIKQSEERILNAFNLRFDLLQDGLTKIKTRVEKLEEHIPKIESLKAEIMQIKQHLNRREAMEIAADIRLTGIPANDNEDLGETFKKIASVINAPPIGVNKIFRVNSTKYDTIIVKCTSATEKNKFLKALSLHKKQKKDFLKLNQIGFHSNAPIYVNESLTKMNYKIFQAAVKLKKTNRIKSTYTFRGQIFIKKDDGDKGVLIQSIEDLCAIVPDST